MSLVWPSVQGGCHFLMINKLLCFSTSDVVVQIQTEAEMLSVLE